MNQDNPLLLAGVTVAMGALFAVYSICAANAGVVAVKSAQGFVSGWW